MARMHNYICFVQILEKSAGPILNSVEKNSFFYHWRQFFYVILGRNFAQNHKYNFFILQSPENEKNGNLKNLAKSKVCKHPNEYFY